MDWPQIIFGSALVAALLALSLIYGVRQVQMLRALALRGGREGARPDEVAYERGKAWRRLINSGLTLLLGGLIGGALLFLEGPAQKLADARDAEPPGAERPLTGEARSFARLYGWYWVATLLVLLVVVLMAAGDLWATYRYATRLRRRMEDDRRAMIERQASRLREGDGNGG